MTLLHISIPFLLVAGTLLIVGAYFSSGWDGLSLFIYAAIVGAMWAAIVLGWCAWIVLRDGLQASNIAPGAVLMAALLAAGIWGGRTLIEDRRCQRAAAFFATFAQADPAARPALIEQSRRYIDEPTWCGIEMISYRLGLDDDGKPAAHASHSDRLAALGQLLDGGLAPDDRLLYHAARDGDAGAVRLLTERRAALNQAGDTAARWEAYPVRAAYAALRAYERAVIGDDATAGARHLAVVTHFVAGGVDVCAPTEGGLSLAELMTRAGLPWRDWLPPREVGCGSTRR
jgi:hypothetical protein